MAGVRLNCVSEDKEVMGGYRDTESYAFRARMDSLLHAPLRACSQAFRDSACIPALRVGLMCLLHPALLGDTFSSAMTGSLSLTW